MSPRKAQKKATRELTSDVNWAVLGLVIERPGYGSEIRNRFERYYESALSLGESHVYGVLDRLLERGWIEIVPGTSLGLERRQPKTKYRATELGIRAYEDRLVVELAEERRRQELWVRKLAVFAHDPSASQRVIGRAEQEYLKTVGSTRSSSGDSRSDRQVLIDRLVAERRGLTEGGMLTWFQNARDGFGQLG